jgi:hypothetical protein
VWVGEATAHSCVLYRVTDPRTHMFKYAQPHVFILQQLVSVIRMIQRICKCVCVCVCVGVLVYHTAHNIL